MCVNMRVLGVIYYVMIYDNFVTVCFFNVMSFFFTVFLSTRGTDFLREQCQEHKLSFGDQAKLVIQILIGCWTMLITIVEPNSIFTLQKHW